MQAKYFFYLQDAGETYAIFPVLQKMKKPYELFVGGVAEKIAIQEKAPHTSLKDLGIERVDRLWKRSDILSQEEVDRILTYMEKGDIFITGVAFSLQGQLLDGCRKRGVYTVAYWDNFDAMGEGSYFETAHQIKEKAGHIFVPSLTVAEDLGLSRTSGAVVGQPSLESWKKEINNAYKSRSFEKYRKHGSLPLVTFIGGYGKAYEQALAFFIEILEKNNFSGRLLVQPHPKSDGSVEKKMYRSIEMEVLEEVTTYEAVVMADLVVCHRSTVGMQALAMGKKVCYVMPPGQSYTNPIIRKGGATLIKSARDWKQREKTAYVDFYQLLGVPEDSIDCFIDSLENKIFYEKKLSSL